MTTTVFNVANHILQGSENKFDLLKLIKLCYLCHGWYLAYHETPLFDERIEAWRYGPVIPELYYALKHFRGKSLPAGCLEKLAIKQEELSEDMKKLIDAVIDYYGKYTGVELSALTHRKGSPWARTYSGEKQPWISIPNSMIKDHFNELKNSNISK